MKKPFVIKINIQQEKFILIKELKNRCFTYLENPDINGLNYPLYVLIDKELCLYSFCSEIKSEEYEVKSMD